METRRKLLGLKSNLQQNWTAYAVANHVAGNAETTVQAIDAFVKTLKVSGVYVHTESVTLFFYSWIELSAVTLLLLQSYKEGNVYVLADNGATMPS